MQKRCVARLASLQTQARKCYEDSLTSFKMFASMRVGSSFPSFPVVVRECQSDTLMSYRTDT